MKTVACVIFVLCLIDVIMVSGQLITPTTCAQFGTAPMPFFNKNLYQGTWFVHQTFDDGTEGYNCYVSIRTPRSDGNHNLTDTLYEPGQPTLHSTGWVIFNKPGYGQELFTHANYPDQSFQFQILSTDYFNYAMEWYCQPYIDASNSLCELFIMSRKAHVSAQTQRKIDAVLKKYHIPTTGLRTFNISVCPAEFFQKNNGGLLGGVLGTVTGLVKGVGDLLGSLLN